MAKNFKRNAPGCACCGDSSPPPVLDDCGRKYAVQNPFGGGVIDTCVAADGLCASQPNNHAAEIEVTISGWGSRCLMYRDCNCVLHPSQCDSFGNNCTYPFNDCPYSAQQTGCTTCGGAVECGCPTLDGTYTLTYTEDFLPFFANPAEVNGGCVYLTTFAALPSTCGPGAYQAGCLNHACPNPFSFGGVDQADNCFDSVILGLYCIMRGGGPILSGPATAFSCLPSIEVGPWCGLGNGAICPGPVRAYDAALKQKDCTGTPGFSITFSQPAANQPCVEGYDHDFIVRFSGQPGTQENCSCNCQPTTDTEVTVTLPA